MEKNEFAELRKRWKESLEQEAKEKLEKNAELIDKFITYASQQGVILQKSDFSYIPTIGIVVRYPDIVKILHPELVVDKDNLVKSSLLKVLFTRHPMGKGYLYAVNHMLFAHPFYRREYQENANYAPRLVDYLWDFKEDSTELSVALDWNRLRIDINNLFCLEFDTWYGAKFKKEIYRIPDGIAKLVPPPELEQSDAEIFFGNVKALNIKWTTSENIRTFVAEEIKGENEIIILEGKKYHPVKYVHSEYGLDEQCFIHLDGAVHLYTEEEYALIVCADMNYNQKEPVNVKSKSVKLFKMNGVIGLEIWQLYVSQFFCQDPLIFEYFEGRYPDHIHDVLKKLLIKR